MKKQEQIGSIKVEWDIRKAQLNVTKHGLSFDTASLVFADEHKVILYDFRHSLKEDRYIVIGLVHKLITVVYTEKHSSYRIISARAATSKERKLYYAENHQKNC